MRDVIDLTKPLNRGTEVYRTGNYHDPPFVVSDWCLAMDHGFWVSKLEMGTQTGTHIDAPAHFIEGGKTLDQLDINACFGSYFLVATSECSEEAALSRILTQYNEESILLLLTSSSTNSLSAATLDALISLGCKLWVVMGECTVESDDPFQFHRTLAHAGVYLVEDLDATAIDAIQPGGEIMALPLRLEGVSGSPCRVIVSMR